VTVTGGDNETPVDVSGADSFCVPDLFSEVDLLTCGGGISNGPGSQLTLTNDVITGNTAQVGGGVFNDHYAQLTVNTTTISNNQAIAVTPLLCDDSGGGVGGGLYNGGGYDFSSELGILLFLLPDSVTLNGAKVTGNRALAGGAGLMNFGNSTMALTSTTVSGNYFTSHYYANGAGIYNTGFLNLNKSLITGNGLAPDFSVTADNGGGIFSLGDGEFVLPGSVQISASTVSFNVADYGAGIQVRADNGAGSQLSILNNSSINGNKALWYGGGLFAYQASVSLSNSKIQTMSPM
jgi:hypothetical protein